MMFFDSLASLSDLLVYTAIAIHALAFLAYSADASQRVRRRPDLAATSAALSTVGAERTPSRLPDSQPASGQEERAASTPGWAGAVGMNLLILGWCFTVASVVARGLAAQRAPWGNMYEFVLVLTAVVPAVFLVLLRRHPVQGLGLWVAGLVTLALGLAVTVLYTPVDELIPVLNSYWLVVHVAAAILSGGIFTIGALAACAFLFRDHRERRRGQPSTDLERRSRLTTDGLSRLSNTVHAFAFPIWTFAVLAGAIWAENSWGRYWGWDPKETWAFITWVLYAAYLHAESTAGWRGRRAAWFAVAGYVAFLFNFFGVNMWISGLHSYAGV